MNAGQPHRRSVLLAGAFLSGSSLARAAGHPPLPTGARVVCLGDSIIEAGNGGGDPIGKGVESLARGEAVLAQAMDPRFQLDTWPDASRSAFRPPTYFWGANQGCAGEPSAGALARVSGALALSPDVLVVATGTNDLQNPAAVVAHLDSICTATLRAKAAIEVVVATIRPVVRGTPAAAARPLDHIRSVNEGLRDLARRRPHVVLWDAYAALAGPDGYGASGDFEDGLHPSPAGALKSGALASTSLRAALATLIAAGDICSPLFAHDLAASLGRGAEASRLAGVHGEVRAGLQVVPTASTTAALSCAVRSGSQGPVQEVRVRVTAAREGVQAFVIRPRLLSLGLPPALRGAWIRLWADLAFDGWPGWMCPNAALVARSDPARRAIALAGGQDHWIAGAKTLRLLTPTIPMSRSSVGVTPSISVPFRGVVGEGAVRLLRWGVAPTQDPRREYHA